MAMTFINNLIYACIFIYIKKRKVKRKKNTEKGIDVIDFGKK